MTLLTVVKDVCAVVGVEQPTSVFSNLSSNRTMAEMLALANEMAQRIAYNTREWTMLSAAANLPGFSETTAQGITFSNIPLPADYKRMLLTTDVLRKSTPTVPMTFVPDYNEWIRRQFQGPANSSRGAWMLYRNHMHVYPALTPGVFDPLTIPPWQNNHAYNVNGELARDVTDNSLYEINTFHVSAMTGTFAQDRAANPTYWVHRPAADSVFFVYLHKNCIMPMGDPLQYSDVFLNDADMFRLDERLLKLGMIWQWKANKGSPYAEDMANYATALDVAAGSDKPAPIIIGRTPISANARVAYPWPSNWGPQ